MNLFLFCFFIFCAPGVVGLFSTGPGGRHDWMRFHYTDVRCPKKKCSGVLLWADGKRTVLACDYCKARYEVTVVKEKAPEEG